MLAPEFENCTRKQASDMSDSSRWGAAPSDEAPPDASAQLRKWLRDAWRRCSRQLSIVLAIVTLLLIAHWTYDAIENRATQRGAELATAFGLATLAVRFFTPIQRISSRVLRITTPSTPLTDAESMFDRARLRFLKESTDRLTLLEHLLRQPTESRSRVVESVTLDRQVTVRRVTTWFTVADQFQRLKLDGDVLIPTLVSKKGRLYDRPVVETAAGEVVHTLAQDEALEILCALLLYNIQRAFDFSPDFELWTAKQGRFCLNLLHWVILSKKQMAGYDDKAVRKLIVASMKSPTPSDARAEEIIAIDAHAEENVVDLVHMLATRYVVLAVVPSADSFMLTHSYQEPTKTFYASKSSARITFPVRLVQEALGLRNGVVVIPLLLARKARSYHLYVTVPSGSYVGPVSIFKRETREPIEANLHPPTALTTPYLRAPVVTPTGIHVYGRGLIDLPQCALEMRVYERPIGSELLGTVSVLALTVLALALRVASKSGDGDTDIPAVMLAVPVAFLTVAALFSPVARRSLTLSSAGVTAAVLASLGAVALTVMFAIDLSVSSSGPSRFSTFWNGAVTAAVTISIYFSSVLIIRSLRYALRMRRLGKGSQI